MATSNRPRPHGSRTSFTPMQELLILAILLVMSGLFSGSETALTSLSLARAQALHREGRRGATAVYRLKKDQSRMLIAILIGNNLVNTGASALATVVATEEGGKEVEREVDEPESPIDVLDYDIAGCGGWSDTMPLKGWTADINDTTVKTFDSATKKSVANMVSLLKSELN